MNNDEEIKNVISKLHLLLHNCGNESWATKLAYIHVVELVLQRPNAEINRLSK